MSSAEKRAEGLRSAMVRHAATRFLLIFEFLPLTRPPPASATGIHGRRGGLAAPPPFAEAVIPVHGQVLRQLGRRCRAAALHARLRAPGPARGEGGVYNFLHSRFARPDSFTRAPRPALRSFARSNCSSTSFRAAYSGASSGARTWRRRACQTSPKTAT